MKATIQELLSHAVTSQLQQASNTPLQENSPEDMPDDFFNLSNDEVTVNEQAEEPDFQLNLAEDMSPAYMDDIAAELLDCIDNDEESRHPWMEMIDNVRGQLGIGESTDYEQPFPGSSTVVYPIITKAQIQFQARALPEIFPNNPAKAVVIGESNPMLDAQADRVSDVLNYQITYQDKGNKKDFRKMLWWLPLTGSTFRRVYHDPLCNMNKVRFVPIENLIVPYGTTSLMEATRISYRDFDTKNDMLKLMQMGFYLEIPLTDDGDVDEDNDNPAQKLRDDSDGETKTTNSKSYGNLQEYYNVYTEYDLEGYEDKDDEGNPTGIGLPYIFTIHARSRKILAIRRNWKEDDPLKLRRMWFVHYQYQEGPGFYGSGLSHLIGSLQEAATGAIRAFGDSMAFSMLQGGWKLEDAKFSGSAVFSPGQFQDVDCSLDDINKALKVANFQSPSPEVLKYIEILDNQAQTIVSTQDIMTGDQSSQNAPVGSTLAIIEQAQKVITGQHKSLYESFSEELQILYDLNYDYLPDDDKFEMPGKVGIIRREDFDGSMHVIPTADPSVASFQQRQAIDQACLQFSQMPQFAPYYRDHGYELLKRMLNNMNVPSIDEIIYTEQEVKQKMQQDSQTPPPPTPEMIKAQAIATDSHTKAMIATRTADQGDKKLMLEEKSIDFDTAIKSEANDIKAGTLNPEQQQLIDNITAMLMRNSIPQMQGQQIPPNPGPPGIANNDTNILSPQQIAPSGVANNDTNVPLTQGNMPNPATMQSAPPAISQPPQPNADPRGRNLLMQLMDKVRRNKNG
jgi:hypothetical protein